MYNMSIDNNRITAQLNLTYNKMFKKVRCVYDTGAMYTAINALSLDFDNSYKDYFRNVAEVKYIGGLIVNKDNKGISSDFAVYYKLHLNEVSIGNIVLKDVQIWVTFDDNVSNDIIGMDIISRLYTFICDGEVHVTNNKDEFNKFITSRRRVLNEDLPPIILNEELPPII